MDEELRIKEQPVGVATQKIYLEVIKLDNIARILVQDACAWTWHANE